MAAFGHGLAGVDRQVYKYLLYLTWVGEHRTEVGFQLRHQFDMLAKRPAQQLRDAGDHRVQVEHAWLHHLAAAQVRAATVLDGMVADHVIDAKAANAAKANPATVKASPGLAPAASWFADWVAKGAAPLVGSQAGSVRVRTTLMPDLQNLAQQVVDDALDKQDRKVITKGWIASRRRRWSAARL